MVLTQFILMYILRNKSWPILLLVAYCLGGVINHSLMLGKWKPYIAFNKNKKYEFKFFEK